MAVVGEAHILVRAITTRVRDDIRRGFAGVDGEGRRAGQGIGKAFQNGFLREAERAYDKFRALSAIGFIVGPAIAGVAAALSSVVSGLFAFGSQMAAAAPAALGLAGALSALLQAAMALKFAMAGVGAAISAGLNAGGGGGGGGVDLASYYDRIEEARRNLAQTLERAAEQEERAQEAVTEAYEEYQDAIIRTSKAIDDYRKAQKEAAEQTQQLNFDVEDAALAQERASIALEEARARLAAVSDLPIDSAARREAELAFKEADLNYRRTADTNNDLKQEQEEAVAAGSAGAEDLVRASEDVLEAKNSEADAFKRYEQAIVDAERTRRDAQRQILEAEEALLDALEALEKAGAGGGGGIDAFAAAMAKLSPEAQDFVRYVISIQDSIKQLRAAAGKELFPKLIDSLKMVVDDVFPVLERTLLRTGGAIGDFALSLSKSLTQTKNLKALERVMNTNSGVIRDFGGAAGDLLTVIIQLLDAARPLTKEFAAWIEKVAGGWEDIVLAKKGTGELADTLEYAGGVAKQLGDVFGNVITAFGNLGKSASGPGSGGEMLLDTFQDATQRFEEFTEAIGADGTAEAFFMNAAENLKSISTTVVKIVKGFIELGDNGGVKQFFDSINEGGGAIDTFFSALEKMISGNVGAIMGDVANNIGKIIDAIAESGSIEIFFGILKAISGALADFLSNDTVQKILPIVAAIHAISAALWLVMVPLKFFGKAWIGFFAKMSGAIGFVIGKAKILWASFQALALISGQGFLGTLGVIASAAAPFLAIAVAIAAVVAVLIGAYVNSEKFRESISELISSIGQALMSAWGSIQSGFEGAANSIGRVFGAVGGLAGVFRMVGDALSVVVGLISAQWSGIIRFIGATIGAVVRVIGSVLGGALNFIKGIFQGITSALGGMGDGVKNAGSFFDGLKKAVTTFWNVASQVVSWLGTAYSWVYDNFVSPIMNIVGRLLGYIIGFVAKIAIAINPITYIIKGVIAVFGMARDFIMQYWDEIVQATENAINMVIDVINVLIDAFNKVAGFLGMDEIERIAKVDFSSATASVTEFGTAVGTTADETSDAAVAADAAARAVDDFHSSLNRGNDLIAYEEAMDELRKMFKGGVKEIDFGTKKGREYGRTILDNIAVMGDQIETTEGVTAKQKLASEGLGTLTKGLKDTKMPPKTKQALIDAMQGIIDQVKAAGGDTSDLQKKLDALKSKTITVTVKYNVDKPPPGAAAGLGDEDGTSNGSTAYGGLITGPGTSTSDSVRMRLSNGEFVIRAASVRRFGAGFFENLNRGVVPGAQMAMASSAPTQSASSAPVTVNVYPSAGMDERQLAAKVSRAIVQQMRKGGA